MRDRARPGLVAFYDIQPGNGAGLFLQPRSPHGVAVACVRSVRTHWSVCNSEVNITNKK